MNRDEIIEWLIARRNRNPVLRRYIDHKLFATDNLQQIEDIEALLTELKTKKEEGE